MNVRFVLTEAAADVAVRATASEQSLATLRARRAELAKSFPPTHPDLAALDTMIARREREIESAGRRPVRNGTQAKASGRRRIIDTSFRMDVGETVVVGTSRVQGDKALIALLTAVAQRGSAAR